MPYIHAALLKATKKSNMFKPQVLWRSRVIICKWSLTSLLSINDRIIIFFCWIFFQIVVNLRKIIENRLKSGKTAKVGENLEEN